MGAHESRGAWLEALEIALVLPEAGLSLFGTVAIRHLVARRYANPDFLTGRFDDAQRSVDRTRRGVMIDDRSRTRLQSLQGS